MIMVGETDSCGNNDLPAASETWSRTTSACNGCRSRKQKCGGERPVCERCHILGHLCEWPKAQKRGPAKGYTEALEARLIETETVLIKILSAINVSQLSTALLQTIQQPAPVQEESSTRPGSTLGVARKAAIEYWSKFPLSTPEELSHWLADRNPGQNSITQTRDIASEEHLDDESGSLEMKTIDYDSRQLEPPQSRHLDAGPPDITSNILIRIVS
ncbi:hypothetical protein BGZ60DRAFT_153257 [Tricladium varicosporioides]|nr:hypothetical protein BGZ60DRAFT_153257 [Hymenoscyphus varicosporioides]